jgi:hypothetical protein
MPAHLHVVSSKDSVRHAPCPDSPSHSQKALKVASPATKARGDPGPAALQEDSGAQWGDAKSQLQTASCALQEADLHVLSLVLVCPATSL